MTSRDRPQPDAPSRRSAADPLTELAALGQTIAGATSTEAIVGPCADLLEELTQATHLALGAHDAKGTLQVLTRRGPGTPDDDLQLLAFAEVQGPVEIPAHAGTSLAARGLPADPGIETWIGIPMQAGDAILGALVLGAPAPGLAPGAGAVARAVAAQAGIALRNAQLMQALSLGKLEWELTVDAITDGICVLDADGIIRRANRTFCALADVPVTEVAGRPWISLTPPTWVDTFQQLIAGEHTGGTAELRAGDRQFQVTALPLTDGGAASVVLVLADHTERRRLQEQLIQSEKMSAIGQLIAGVAHDLNNPLASVVGFADYLVETSDNVPAELIEPLRAIQQEAERAAGIVRNLLNFARKQERRREVIPVRDVLRATLLLLRNQLMAAKVDADIDVAPGVPALHVDVNQIQQVFVNLVNNAAQAIQASGIGSRIVVRAVPWLDGVAITVEDDGPGLEPEIAPRVFEPFFTTKPAGEGTGLGLSICQGIVKEHGGRLSLVPTAGRGTVFQVELPAGAAPPVAQPEAPAEPARRLRVLVVDDEPHIQHYMRATLEAWGHSVTVAENGRAGLDLALAEPYDVILSDLRMPELGGREMFEALRAERPEAADRVVFNTGDTVRGDTMTFLESLGRPFLRKPFTLAELRQVLSDAIRRTS